MRRFRELLHLNRRDRTTPDVNRSNNDLKTSVPPVRPVQNDEVPAATPNTKKLNLEQGELSNQQR